MSNPFPTTSSRSAHANQMPAGWMDAPVGVETDAGVPGIVLLLRELPSSNKFEVITSQKGRNTKVPNESGTLRRPAAASPACLGDLHTYRTVPNRSETQARPRAVLRT